MSMMSSRFSVGAEAGRAAAAAAAAEVAATAAAAAQEQRMEQMMQMQRSSQPVAMSPPMAAHQARLARITMLVIRGSNEAGGRQFVL